MRKQKHIHQRGVVEIGLPDALISWPILVIIVKMLLNNEVSSRSCMFIIPRKDSSNLICCWKVILPTIHTWRDCKLKEGKQLKHAPDMCLIVKWNVGVDCL